MRPEFARAVDPIFLYVIDLLERIQGDENVPAIDERAQIRAHFDRAESLLGPSDEWQLAKYALATWIDEMLIEAPWPGSQYFNANKLQFEFFRSAEAYVDFYRKAQEASALRKKDALEVFYVCVILGFRGLYRDPTHVAALAEALELPPDLDTWAQRTADVIKVGRYLPPIGNGNLTIEGAPPLDGPFVLIWACLLGLVLAVFDTMLVLFAFFFGK